MSLKRVAPGPGQESVWNYPRPPRLEDCSKQLRIIASGVTIANTRQAKRVLETSHPPVYYLPPDDIRMDLLVVSSGQSWCEWKGRAHYYDLVGIQQPIKEAAWSYPSPTTEFASIKNFVAFYPGKMDACFVEDEQVQPQPGSFYGGWITSDIVGPFKGEPGTMRW